ncbi:MAG TPA: FtsW/RodA/SpoVE family cell cycle protein, partial [Anaerolineales bacterium]|nr:FtsW/RodA/SpoVE family cell cycle protein [Anaerolineales bacterium]
MTTTYKPTAERKRRANGVRMGFDAPLLIVVVLLVLFGLVMVFSASWEMSFEVHGDHTTMFFRQVLFMVGGIFLALITSMIDYHEYRRFARVGAVALIIALAFVVLFGDERFGATRSISNGSIMPSEAAKLGVIIYLCVWMYAKRHEIHKIGFGLVPLGVILGVFGGLIFAQPDISATFTVVMLGGILFFIGGGDLKQVFILVMVAVLFGILVVMLMPTARDRMMGFTSGLSNIMDAPFHVRRSVESFVRGGLFGVGIDNAEIKLTSLPFPATDSIFAVVAEEMGMIGTTFVIGLYVVFIWRGMQIARQSSDMLGALLASGITFWIAIEACINMANMVGLMP